MAVDQEVSATRKITLIVAFVLAAVGLGVFLWLPRGQRIAGVALVAIALGAAVIALVAPPIVRWLVARGRKPS